MQNRKKKAPARDKGRQLSFSLGPGGLVLGLGLALLLLVWAFILGVLVGRGYYPEAFLARLGLRDAAQQEQAEESQGKEGPQVLRAEELGFFDALQLEWEQGFQELKPQAGSSPSSAQASGQEQEQDPAQGQEEEEEQERFAYIYQVAAFQEKSQAEGLQQRLSSAGIESYIQDVDKQEQRWYRVYVPHVGTPQENQQLQGKLQGLGLDKLFVRSKKPF
ncbi:MAG: SPOR domain-containing protein [Desulfohalobiaceae bacterium]